MIGGTREAWQQHLDRQRRAARLDMVVATGAVLILVLAIGVLASVWLLY